MIIVSIVGIIRISITLKKIIPTAKIDLWGKLKMFSYSFMFLLLAGMSLCGQIDSVKKLGPG